WLDDFGAGLTSFNEVFLEGLSGIKIDRNLLRRSIDSGDAFQALKVVTDFARVQGKICVIEGAEDDAERAYAEAKGATHVQGFFSGVI
ncbi:MAG: EAL domain-containing protein, partial [Alphaproteobacteria bacterium]